MAERSRGTVLTDRISGSFVRFRVLNGVMSAGARAIYLNGFQILKSVTLSRIRIIDLRAVCLTVGPRVLVGWAERVRVTSSENRL